MHELTHLSDDALVHAVASLMVQDRATTACLLAHLAEIEARELYLALGHTSMFAYTVEALRLSENAALRRIHAARAARRFPRLLALVSDGTLHLSAICMLAPKLSAENFDELVAAAARSSKSQLERWLATRFAPPLLLAAAGGTDTLLVPGRVDSPEPAAIAERQLVPGRVAPPTGAAPAVAPHVVVRLALPEATHAKLRHAQALLAHAVPGGELAKVVDRALDSLIGQLERRKFAATKRPRKPRPAQAAARPRTIPAHVKRAVWQRDEGRCAFVSPQGRRCSARARLEFDHVTPVARGGTAQAVSIRLLCRAHNQFEAERVFGRAFMQRKRARAASSTRPGTSCRAQGRASEGEHHPAPPDPGV